MFGLPIAGILLSAAQWLLGTKTGRVLMLVLAGLAAFGAYTVYIEHKAATEAVAKETQRERAATAAENTRRQKALDAAQREAAISVARLAQTERKNADLLQKIRRLSAARNSSPCLDLPATDRLRGLGASGQ